MVEELDKKPALSLFADSESSDSDSDHDLTFHTANRVKFIKKIFKVINAKRIIQMAPECLRNMPLAQMKTLLLEELMGMSKKRLTAVIHNKPREGSSSSDSDHHRLNRPNMPKIDGGVISLDDITDDDTAIIDDAVEIEVSEREKLEIELDYLSKGKRKHKKQKILKKKRKIKKEPDTLIKEEKVETIISSQTTLQKEEPVMSALNLLELQARARAIRSQLRVELETNKSGDKNDNYVNDLNSQKDKKEGGDSPNSVVILSPARDIVNVSSHTEESGSEETDDTKERSKSKNAKTILEETIENDNDVLIMSVSLEDMDSEFILNNDTTKDEDSNAIDNIVNEPKNIEIEKPVEDGLTEDVTTQENNISNKKDKKKLEPDPVSA